MVQITCNLTISWNTLSLKLFLQSCFLFHTCSQFYGYNKHEKKKKRCVNYTRIHVGLYIMVELCLYMYRGPFYQARVILIVDFNQL